MSTTAKSLIQILITAISAVAILIHIFFPAIKIDALSVTLFIVSIIPWLSPLFKSVELPGGIKIEYQDLKKISEQAVEAGLIVENTISLEHRTEVSKTKYPFLEIAGTNPALALVALRIEIEKTLRLIAKRYGAEEERQSLRSLIKKLGDQCILSSQEQSALLNMTATLNHASHGAEYDPRNAEWIMTNGPAILDSLNSKLEDRRGAFSVGRSDEQEHWIDASFNNSQGLTNFERRQNITKHSELWEKEINNLYQSLLKKLAPHQKEALIESHNNWQKQMELEQNFIGSFEDLFHKVGTEGMLIIGLTFMSKKRTRALELSEILSLFADVDSN